MKNALKTFRYKVTTTAGQAEGSYQAKTVEEVEKMVRDAHTSKREEIKSEKDGKPHTYVNEAVTVKSLEIEEVQ